MKLMINGYEVEIKAKYTADGVIENARMNKKDTKAFINEMCIWASECSFRHSELGLDALAKRDKKAWRSMFETLKAQGYYEE